ncbi:hypothetical protein C1645_760883, partial [Glomus cerebriforme]
MILIYSLLKSEPHFTKWTLFQLFVTSWFNSIAALPPIIFYGDELMKRAFETPLCLISNKVSAFTLYPMQFFPLFIAFYLWYALSRRRGDIEKKCFLWVTAVIWLFTIAFSIFDMLMSFHEKNLGVVVTPLHCKRSLSTNTFYGYTLPTACLALIAFIMTCHSSYITYIVWRNHQSGQNRTTAITLGRVVRLNMFCIIYIIFLLITLVPRILNHSDATDTNSNASLVSSYMGATPGILLFLIFGAKKQAALFLPFCYYVPPGKPTRGPDNIGSIHMEFDVTSISSRPHDDHELPQVEELPSSSCQECHDEYEMSILKNNLQIITEPVN